MSDFAVPQEMRLEDAPAATAETQQQSPKTSREAAMEAIYGKRDLQIREELEQGATDEAERAAAAEDRETERAGTELAQRAQAGTETRGQQQLRTVTIDGSPMQVTEAQYEQLARDGMLARQTVAQYQRQAAYQQQPVARAPDPAPTIEPGEAAELARRIQYGDTDEVAHAVQHLAQRIAARQPQIDPRAIVQAATQQMLQTQELNNNLHTIGTEFPDIFNDRTLSQLAALKLGELRQRDAALGQSRPDLDSYREACRMVRGALGPRDAQPQSRLDRKRGTPTLPSASDRRSISAPAERYPTGSEIVARMQKQRGQF